MPKGCRRTTTAPRGAGPDSARRGSQLLSTLLHPGRTRRDGSAGRCPARRGGPQTPRPVGRYGDISTGVWPEPPVHRPVVIAEAVACNCMTSRLRRSFRPSRRRTLAVNRLHPQRWSLPTGHGRRSLRRLERRSVWGWSRVVRCHSPHLLEEGTPLLESVQEGAIVDDVDSRDFR